MKKKVIIGIVAAVVVVGGIGTYLFLNQNPLEVAKEKMTVEYGQKISTDAKDYLKKDVDSDVVKETKVSVKNSKGDYEAVGDYTVVLKYGKKTAEVKVTVKDTVAPQVTATPLSVEVGTKVTEDMLKKNVAVTDLAETTLTFETVDTSKAGEYKVPVTVKDVNGNETKSEVVVTVKAVASSNASSGSSSGGSSSYSSGSSGKASGSSSGSSGGSSSSGGKDTSTGAYDDAYYANKDAAENGTGLPIKW